ncbi:hypothetical protein SK128_007845 [Halocaridina rubra]|uniref:Uncharacterized protein n=1 Tax=Halocaridina rubra TaxID=373956 RepID=A0AAN8WPR6_HALRR
MSCFFLEQLIALYNSVRSSVVLMNSLISPNVYVILVKEIEFFNNGFNHWVRFGKQDNSKNAVPIVIIINAIGDV